MSPTPSCRAALRIVAQSICAECSSEADEPCRGCMRDGHVLLDRFLARLPQSESFTPATLAARLKGSGLDG